MEGLQSLILSNPVFSGGLGLAIAAVSSQFARSGLNAGVFYFKRHFLITLEVTSKDNSYPWLLQWIHKNTAQHNRHISVETSKVNNRKNNDANVKFSFVPGPGQHILNYKNKWYMVYRVREQSMMDLNSGKPWEKVQIVTIGRDTKVFENMLSEAYSMVSKQEEGMTIIYSNWGAEWRPFGNPRKKRSLDSVVLDNGLSEKLVADITEWVNSSDWYRDRGIPYRRGYLLHGPPGSGKSSFIMALAGYIGYNICILNLSEAGLTDDRLSLALSTVPPQSIILLEDIDAAFPNRQHTSQPKSQRSNDVTFSGLLNVLDGVSSSEDRIIFMTTNYIDRLDPALIRPGRVDYVQLIDNASDFQLQKMFQKFYPSSTLDQSIQFSSSIRTSCHPISMATIQGYLLRYKDNPEASLQNTTTLSQSDVEVWGANQSGNTKSKEDGTTPSSNDPPKRKMRALTTDQVDRMYFNPQPGWDANIMEIK